MGLARLAATEPVLNCSVPCRTHNSHKYLKCNAIHKGAGVEKEMSTNSTTSLQCTASSSKDQTQLVPRSTVVRVKIMVIL
jgi:hypothetical protein